MKEKVVKFSLVLLVFLLSISLALAALSNYISVTGTATVIAASKWVQTTQADFEAGIKTNVVTTNVAGGEVKLSSSTATSGITSTGSTTYPTSTVGQTGVLGSTAEAQGTLSAQKITIPSGGATIKSVIIYWGAVSRAGSVQFAFYNDNAGNPSTIISGTSTGTVAVGTDLAGKWQTISYGTPFYLSAGTYWLARQTTDPVDGKGPKRNYALTGGPGRKSRSFSWGDFPSSFGIPTTSDYLDESQYTTYVRIKGYAKATKITISDNNANIQSVSFYSHATGNFRLAIYSDSSGPSSKLLDCPSTTATASAWNTVSISSCTPASLTLNSGTYWLAWQWDSANPGPSYTAGSSGDGNNITQAYGSFPATWSGGTLTSEKWSIYASYTTQAIAGTLESQSFDASSTASWKRIYWTATKPASTDVKFQIAINDDGSTWNFVGPDGTASTYYTTSGTDIWSSQSGRYVKFKVYLSTSDTSTTPVLDDVTIYYRT
jgi:hypothetical protein